jgi:hypothetical protein
MKNIVLTTALAAIFAILPIATGSLVHDDAFGLSIPVALAGGGGGDGGGGGGDGGGSSDSGGGCCGDGPGNSEGVGNSGPGDGGSGSDPAPDPGPGPGGDSYPTPYATPAYATPAYATPAPAAPVCTLSAAPNSFGAGGGTTALTWTTSNATAVSIDQGVGAVGLNGTTNASVTSSRTYTLTATGPGGTVTCTAPVTVAAAPALSCDSFTAAPNSHGVGGGTSVLTWNTTGATSVSIDNGVGAVAVDGSQSVTVPSSRTYTLTATNGSATVTCTAPVTVASAPGLTCDAFSASPNSHGAGGGTSVLTWNTTGATSVSIDNGVGSVAVDGTQSVTVSSSITYTLTASNGSATVTCTAPITVGSVPPPGLSCDAFTASPNSFPVGGGNTVLTWNTTGATSVSIDNGVGSVAVDGSQTVSVPSSRTFTLTASNGSGTVTCNVPVTVDTGGGGGGGGGGSSAPRCDAFRASESRIEEGESVTLTWKTRRGTRLEIDPSVLETRDDDKIDGDSIVVRPTKTTKYTLTVYKGSRKDTCTVTVRVGDRIEAEPITSISFREIPYTGFEAGPWLTSLFYTLLALWSAAVAYILVIKREAVFGFSLPLKPATVGTGAFIPKREVTFHAPAPAHDAPVAAAVATMPASAAPSNLPSGSAYGSLWDAVSAPIASASHDEEEGDEVAEETDEDDSLAMRLENDAHAHNVLLSSDAMRAIQDHGETEDGAIALLDTLIERAKAAYPREDGWIVLNRERVMALFATAEAPKAAPVASAPAPVAGAHTLAEAIVTSNTQAAYAAIAEEPIHAIADAAEALDAVLRTRLSGAAGVDMLSQAAAHLSNDQLKNAVSALVSAIDGTYSDEVAAIRLAVIKALKAVA